MFRPKEACCDLRILLPAWSATTQRNRPFDFRNQCGPRLWTGVSSNTPHTARTLAGVDASAPGSGIWAYERIRRNQGLRASDVLDELVGPISHTMILPRPAYSRSSMTTCCVGTGATCSCLLRQVRPDRPTSPNSRLQRPSTSCTAGQYVQFVCDTPLRGLRQQLSSSLTPTHRRHSPTGSPADGLRGPVELLRAVTR